MQAIPEADGATDVAIALAIGAAVGIGNIATIPTMVALGTVAPAIVALGCAALAARHFPQLCNPIATGLWFAGRAIGDATPLTIAQDGLVANIAPALATAFSEERAAATWKQQPQLPAPQSQPAPVFAPLAQSTPSRQNAATPLRTSRNRTSAELLDDCMKEPHIGVVGKTGAGKTCFLQNLIVRFVNEGAQVVVIDPQGSQRKWSMASQVVGNSPDGPKFDDIYAVLADTIATMRARSGELWQDAEEDSFPRLVIVCDEWRDIATNIPEAGKMLEELLTMARKTSIKMVLGTQSKNVKALFGDKAGDGAIRDCLTLLYLIRDKATGERYAMLEDMRYDVPVPLLLPTIPPVHPVFTQDFDDVPHTSIPTDNQIRGWIESGWSKNQVCERLTGTKSVRLARINQALEGV